MYLGINVYSYTNTNKLNFVLFPRQSIYFERQKILSILYLLMIYFQQQISNFYNVN